MRILQTEYRKCYIYIKKHFSNKEFGSISTLTTGFLGYLGFNISKRWMKRQTNEDRTMKFKVRRAIGKVMKTLLDNDYVSKVSNTTWKKETVFPNNLKNERITHFLGNEKILL